MQNYKMQLHKSRFMLPLGALTLWLSALVFPAAAQTLSPLGDLQHSPKLRLSKWLNGLDHLEKKSKTPLSKAQSQRVVQLVKPFAMRATLGESEAKTLTQNLSKTLTAPQTHVVEGFIAAQTDAPPEGERPNFATMLKAFGAVKSFVATFNPLASPRKDASFADLPVPIQKRMLARWSAWQSTFAALEKKARRRN